MNYTISWGVEDATVSTPVEADEVLDRIAAGGRRYMTYVAPDPDDGDGPLIQMVWGDPDRAMLTYTDHDFGGRAVEPGIPLADRDLDYDSGSVEPDRTRLSAKAARAAVAEFVATGQRPTCVTWER
ncbi:MAG: hypothetical protein V7603_1564 [Micromonosporaceae bacterium]|jgi:hypothetical protein